MRRPKDPFRSIIKLQCNDPIPRTGAGELVPVTVAGPAVEPLGQGNQAVDVELCLSKDFRSIVHREF